ncbi:MAG: DUF3566 domain-containing protein [bacterium]
MRTIKSIEPLSLGKIYGATMALFGLLIGGLLALFSVTVSGIMSDYGGGTFMPGFFGALAIIVLPIFYGILGFIAGVLGAFFYNIVAKLVGGIKIELS